MDVEPSVDLVPRPNRLCRSSAKKFYELGPKGNWLYRLNVLTNVHRPSESGTERLSHGAQPQPFTMILVQKPPLSQYPLHAHRRHQSAPTLQMLPTRTPGLLTISKQPRPPLKRKSLPKSKSTTVVRPSLLNLPPEITEDNKSGLPASQFRQRRGRGQVKRTKDRVQNQR